MGDIALQLFRIELGGVGEEAKMMRSINHSVSRVKLFVLVERIGNNESCSTPRFVARCP